MGHALVQHLARPATHCPAVALAILCASCVGAQGNGHPPPPPARRTVAYVSPIGDDAASGEQAAPYRTIAKALGGDFERIVLLRGAHDEERIEIGRPVTIEGDGTVVLRGHVSVSGNRVALRHLRMNGGLSAQFVEGLAVESATIAAGAKDDSASITRSSASFSGVELSCGPMSCLQATTATIAIDGCVAKGQSETKRVMRFDMSVGRIAKARLEQSAIANLQIGGGSRIEVSDLRSIGGSNGIVVAQGASLVAKSVTVEGAAKMSLVGQRAKLRIDDSTIGPTRDQTIGLSGADAVFRRTVIEGSPKGAVSVIDHIVGKAVVRIEDGEIRHGSASGILVGSGSVTIAGVRFVGGKATKEENDAITANGIDSRVIVESATMEMPAGFGVAFHADASGSVTATISNPHLGGVLVDDVAAEPIVIARSVLKGCGEGSGIVVQEEGKVVVQRARIEACQEAGILAGEKSTVVISDSALLNNPMYGCAAFGSAVIELTGTWIKGSKFATFASCGDGARVEDKGQNRLEGSVSACP